MPQQLTLEIDPPHQQRLDNFIVGENQELVNELSRTPKNEFRGIWLCGGEGTGKSHLLRGVALSSSGYVCFVDGGASAPRVVQGLVHAEQVGDTVIIDAAEGVLGEEALEEHLFLIYQRLLLSGGRLLVAARQPAREMNFILADLRSRMQSLEHFALTPLSDEDKAELLKQRASSRGYELSDSVVRYWLARGPRSIEALLTDLTILDRASLAEKRVVTVPLLKEVLGY